MMRVGVVAAFTVIIGSAQDSPNVKTMNDVCTITQEMAGATVNQALMTRLMPRLMWHYASKVDCNQVATSDEFGFSLKGVSYQECLGETIKKYQGTQITSMECAAIVETGNSVMVYQPSSFKLATGQTVTVPIFSKYDFNDMGKIVAYTTQFDTSVFDAVAPAARNTATIKYQCQIFREMMAGQTISKSLLDKILPEMMGFYAPTVNCEQVQTSTDFGFSLKSVPVSTCFNEATKKWGGLQMIDLECKHVTVDKNGETVMLYQPSTFRLPTGRMVNLPILNRYDFNSQGKIISYSMQFDTSVLEAYTSHFANGPQYATSAANRNSAVVRNQCKIMQEMASGQTISQPLTEKLLPEMMGFYAATVDCDQVATSAQWGFSLRDVPITTCWGEATKKYGGMQIVQWKCEDVAADGSGDSVMLYQPSIFKLPTGEMVSVPIITKYNFNDEGKIVSYSSQFDTSVLGAYGSRLAYNSPYATPAARNAATVEKNCQVQQQMVGQTVSQTTVDSVMTQIMGAYTSRISCNSVATSAEFGFSLQDASLAECLAQDAKKYGGFHIVNWRCADVASDETGKSVVLFQPSTFVTPAGQMVSVPIFTKYDFNEDGKIVAFSTQFDTSVFSQGYIAKSLASTQVWTTSFLPFVLGCSVAAFAMHLAMRRRQPPLSQEGYNPCA